MLLGDFVGMYFVQGQMRYVPRNRCTFHSWSVPSWLDNARTAPIEPYREPLGDAIDLLLHRVGVGVDVDGDGFGVRVVHARRTITILDNLMQHSLPRYSWCLSKSSPLPFHTTNDNTKGTRHEKSYAFFLANESGATAIEYGLIAAPRAATASLGV
jgi:Flp/Fap pilin component